MKFYTDEGIWDLVGNNIPVFFIQDAIKFPDLIHAVKPEPHNEVPQGQSAHNNFWDFAGLQPECERIFLVFAATHCLTAFSRSYGYVGHVRQGNPPLPPNDARLWREYIYTDQR